MDLMNPALVIDCSSEFSELNCVSAEWKTSSFRKLTAGVEWVSVAGCEIDR